MNWCDIIKMDVMMMDFKQEINELEMFNCCDDFVFYKGEISILFSAPHTMRQKRKMEV